MWLYKVGRPEAREIDFQFAPPVGSVRLSVRPNDGADAFVVGENLEEMNYNVALPFKPATVLDLGANAGFAAVFLSRKYPDAELACVEPIPANQVLLERNLRTNGIQAHVVRAAISVSDGTIAMQLSQRDYGHKVAGIQFGMNVDGDLVEVEAISVPKLLRTLAWDRIGFLKVDIEGYEAVLLRENASWLALVDAMCIECHEGFSVEDLAEIGKRWGFGPVQAERGTLLMVRECLNK